ncbi:MAG: hypothetical protein VR64_06955 [Desulfatitalea sp. BRH_c12]|nr:MAG: hypothetical protein VR64_06955 [Desulfatitalea sp. BRH_c12]
MLPKEQSTAWLAMIVSLLSRDLRTLIISISALALISASFYELYRMSVVNPYFAHAFFVPWASLYALWAYRQRIFVNTCFSPLEGALFLSLGIFLAYLAGHYKSSLASPDYFCLLLLSKIIAIMGIFVANWGRRAFRNAIFPLFFLLFMVPIPSFLFDPLVHFLTSKSATVLAWVFEIAGIPFVREGFVFQLPVVDIEIVHDCSGIRSALGLTMVSVFAGNLFLKSNWHRLVLVAVTVAVSIIKNGLRIATIALVANYVNEDWVANHEQSGKPFLVLALLFIFLALWLLRLSETRWLPHHIKEV